MSLFAFQDALYDLLSADATLTALMPGGVYDHVPQETTYPYAVMGYATTDNAGTKTEDMRDFTITIDVWSRYEGHKQTKQIQERIRTLLHRQSLALSAGRVVDMQEEFCESFLDQDGQTYHGVQRFGALFES